MLPELILREERTKNFPLLILFGFLCSAAGIAAASMVFPGRSDIVGVFLAAVPLVYPLTQEFLMDEEDHHNGSSITVYVDEVAMYLSLFVGQVAGFFVAALHYPDMFEIQMSVFGPQLQQMGITGYASVPGSFLSILMNNLIVFGIILGLSAIIGSAGAFILSWNGSVLGVFLAVLTRSQSGPNPLLYVPHATLEMSGFIVAGVTGTLISAATYRKHFDKKTWRAVGFLAFAGVMLILAGAIVETA